MNRFNQILSVLKTQNPLVHNITNYVTVNDVANALLAVGASPVMSDDAADVKELARVSSAINLNIGTLNSRTIKSMFIAGKIANQCNKIVVLDPVGVGATNRRTKTALNLIKKIQFDVIKGNMSEIKTLAASLCKAESENNAENVSKTKGVDVSENDIITEKNLSENILIVKNLSRATKSVVVATGPFDLISDGAKCFVVKNGDALMEKVCGTGCMISGLMGAFVSAANEISKTNSAVTKIDGALACVCAMGIAGEVAVKSLTSSEGNSTLKEKIIDNLMTLDDEKLESLSLVEEV